MKFLSLFISLFIFSFAHCNEIENYYNEKKEGDEFLKSLISQYPEKAINISVIDQAIRFNELREPFLYAKLQINWNKEFIEELKTTLKNLSKKSDSCSSTLKYLLDRFSRRETFRGFNLFEDMCGNDADVRIFQKDENDIQSEIFYYYLEDPYRIGLLYDGLSIKLENQKLALSIKSKTEISECYDLSIKDLIYRRNAEIKGIKIDNKNIVYGKFDIFHLGSLEVDLKLPTTNNSNPNLELEVIAIDQCAKKI